MAATERHGSLLLKLSRNKRNIEKRKAQNTKTYLEQMHSVHGSSTTRMLLRDLLNEDKNVETGTGSLFQIPTTLSVKKQALTVDEV